MLKLGDSDDQLEDTLGNGQPISGGFVLSAGIGSLGTAYQQSQRARGYVSVAFGGGGSSSGGGVGGGGGSINRPTGPRPAY